MFSCCVRVLVRILKLRDERIPSPRLFVTSNDFLSLYTLRNRKKYGQISRMDYTYVVFSSSRIIWGFFCYQNKTQFFGGMCVTVLVATHIIFRPQTSLHNTYSGKSIRLYLTKSILQTQSVLKSAKKCNFGRSHCFEFFFNGAALKEKK